MYKVNNMILNKQWVTEEIKKYPEIDENRNDSKHNDENRNTMIWNLWNAAKAVLRGNFTVKQAYHKKTRKISNKQHNDKGNRKRTKKLQSHDKEINNKDQSINKWSRGWKIIEKFNEIKSWFFENINKIDEPWARLTQEKERGPK